VITENGVPIASNIIDQLRKTFTARKTLLRFAAGAQKMLNENWGVRSNFSWENTNKFRHLKSKESSDGITTASAKNSFSIGFGVLYKF